MTLFTSSTRSFSLLLLIGLVISSLSGWTYAAAQSGRQHARNSQPGNFAARNRATIQRIYDNVVYPNQIPVIESGGQAVPEGLFDINARGRISPVGNFTGFEVCLHVPSSSSYYFFFTHPSCFLTLLTITDVFESRTPLNTSLVSTLSLARRDTLLSTAPSWFLSNRLVPRWLRR